jgi:hypothetical protein
MQKLVTIVLSSCTNHGEVELHLEEFFIDGWKVVSMVPVGAGVGHSSVGVGAGEQTLIYGYVAGWLAVLLEK